MHHIARALANYDFKRIVLRSRIKHRAAQAKREFIIRRCSLPNWQVWTTSTASSTTAADHPWVDTNGENTKCSGNYGTSNHDYGSVAHGQDSPSPDT